MNRIYPLLILVILALAGGVWIQQQSQSVSSHAVKLFEDLHDSSNQIESILIENAQGVILHAEKEQGRWYAMLESVQDKYPVAKEKLAELILSLAQTQLIEAKTSKQENYFHLGLQDIKQADSLANLVTIKTANQVWTVLVGNTVSFTQGNYVRKPTSKQAWRTDKTIGLPLDETAWLKQPILPFSSQDIVSLQRVDGQNWQIQRAEDGQLQLNSMPEGSELEYDSILQAMLDSVTALHFEELLPEQALVQSELSLVTELKLQTQDAESISIRLYKQDEQHYVKFEHADKVPYWHGWYYSVSSFSAQQLIKSNQDFLLDTEEQASQENKTVIEEGEAPK
ncbi:DUF4340 domain-containing protein [Paraglaciecola aestuariivivens]